METLTFQLAEGVDEKAFLDADSRTQTELMLTQPGFVRRTTARGDGGRWIVVTFWDGTADGSLPADFTALLDPASVERVAYATLD